MKGKFVKIIFIIMALFLLCSCSSNDKLYNNLADSEITEDAKSVNLENEIEEPDLSQIRSICKLATLECYYHNVAKATKDAGTGVAHWGESKRKFWVEYTGKVKIGVDMSRGNMDVEGTNITIYIPEAEILSIKPDAASTNDTIAESDSWNRNPIQADDVTKAIADAEQSIRENIENDSSLLASAQDRAKKLIENYINQLGEMSGVKFNISWETINDSASE